MHLAGIAAIGYAMHLPWSEIGAGHWSDALKIGTRVDILPCLAIAIAMLVLVDRFLEKHAKPVVAALALATIFIAQPVAHWTDGPVALLAIVNQNSGSLFPLFPWVAFTFCGFLASGIAVSPRASAAAIGALGAAALLLGRVDLSPAGAGFFFQRLTWIAVLVPVCGRLAPLWSPRIVLFAGRESLAIYVVHLLIISQLVTLGLPRMNFARTGALFLAILAATCAIAWAWRRLIVARADRARRVTHRPESSARAA
jgi:uncharacterized membrane protein